MSGSAIQPVTSLYDENMFTLVPQSPYAVTPTAPDAFATGSWDSLSALSAPTGAGTPGQPFAWQNPYAFTPWGTGLDANAGFGAKLGSFLGNNTPLLLGGLQAITGALGAYNGLQAVRTAKDALRQQKKEFNINLSNQVQSYNTAVGDRIAGRHYNTEAERQAALAAAQLTDRSKYGKG